MEASERKQFVAGYTKLLTAAWTEEGFSSRLQADPKAVLSEFDLSVPADAQVDIRTKVEGEGTLDDAIRIWDEGKGTGVYRLYVTDEPQYNTGELSEADLESVVGGSSVSVSCCSCTPSCCCT